MKAEYFVGLDIHKKSWVVAIVCQQEAIFRSRIDSNVQTLFSVLAKNSVMPNNSIFVYEAGSFGYSLYDDLTNRGYQGIVVSPTQIPSEPGDRVKTDFRDSLDLAVKLEAGMLRGIYIPSLKQRAVRDLSRTRWQLFRQRTSLIRQVKSKLLFQGIPYPDKGWSKKLRDFILSIEMDSTHKQAITHLIETLDHIEKRLSRIEQHLHQTLIREGYATQLALLRTIPGIGTRTAEVFITEIGDFKRFPDAEHLTSYLGLTPVEYSSGEKVIRGPISHRGNPRVRQTLIEAAWTTVRIDPRMRMHYNRLSKRIGSRKAIIACARKLIHIMYRMLITGEVYRSEKSATIVH
ncbi:MAG: IS110 family transposase [bacterium]|nr:MAG: IS110 family transposase [bacterium]